jgi:hypothetical protein
MNKVGFCAVHFQDKEKLSRWAILDSWKHLGEHTLMRVTRLIAEGLAAGTTDVGVSQDHLIENYLRDLVIDAAVQMDVKTTPCRSYALMLHLGSPCFLISTGESEPNSVRPMATESWQEADRIIDQMEADMGHFHVRIRSEGDRVSVLIPTDMPHPIVANGTLTGLLQPLEKKLQAALAPKPPEGLKPFFGRARPKMWCKR